MLLALTSAARASEIHLLDIKLLVKHCTGYVFQFAKNTNKSKHSKPRTPSKVYSWTENKKLCLSSH